MADKKSTSTSTADISEQGPIGSELGRATYSAQQVPGAVIIFATGCHPTTGYVDFFEQSPLRIFPPQFIFRTIPPTGMVLQVITPFSIWVMFGANDTVETVTVFDADGSHEIKVEQVPDLAADKAGTWLSGSVMRSDAQGSGQLTAAAVADRATTMATGEEGGGPTTMAVGEEEARLATTFAVGEEGPTPTTMALGEEGPTPTTMALGEEETRVATTLAVGEEGPGPTTMALGEEGPVFTTFMVGEEGATTFAVGEETGGIPTLQRNNPFGGF